MESRAPSGLFPSRPTRPGFREPHPVRLGSVLLGGALAAIWLLLVGLLAASATGYIWLTLVGALVAWACAGILAFYGDRGAAVGIAISTSIGVAVAVGIATFAW